MVDLEATLRSSLDERYEIEGEVGRGAMSVVFRARDLKHDRPVAIKVLRAEVAGAISENRFHREIEVVAGLSHPHILPLHDSGSADGLLYFIMPLVEGDSLREVLDREGPLPVAEAIQVAREIAGALAFAHRHGVIHRDVKPGNIMLTGGHALLADFGIAHVMEAAESELTRTGISVGTPTYMSPEQAAGEGPIDGRSDLYSLGCVLFEMIAGGPPFEHSSARALLTSHLIGEIPSLEERRPETPHALSLAVERAMAKSPEERFATAEEMAAALKDAQTGASGEGANAARRPREDARKLRRWRQALTAVGAVVIFAAIGPGLWNRLFPPEPAYGVADPRGSYVVVPATRAGQTPAEEALVVDVADWLAFRLGGLETVRVVQEADISGAWADLGLEGPTLERLEDGIRLARALRVGTLVTLTLRILGDSAYVEARQYDVADGFELDLVQSQASSQSLEEAVDPLATPFVLAILNYRGGETDPGQILRLSRNPRAHQEFEAGWTALQDWRLEEAEQRFRESIADDSTFALPYHYLAVTLYWQTTRRPELIHEVGGEIARLTERAGQLARNSGLPAGYVAPIEAFAAFWAGDYEGARSLYDAIIARDSTNSEAWLLRGAVEFEDPWAERGPEGGLAPRSDLNLAKSAFETSVRLARDQQLSYGLLFQIDEQVLRAAAGRGCPAFQAPGGPRLPPWQVAEAEDQPAFCPMMDDSLTWIPYDEFEASSRTVAGAGAQRLYRETLRYIQMWADYAPGKPRPREEWSAWLLSRRPLLGCDADPVELAELTRQALFNKQIELEIRGDTTPGDRVRLANLLWATGERPAARAQLDRATSDTAGLSAGSRELPAEAANLFLATGRPSRAMEVAVPAEAMTNYSFEDPGDNSVVSSGDIQPAFTVLRVRGSSGVRGPQLTAAFQDLDRRWSGPEYTPRARAVLHRGSLSRLGPALLLAPETQRAWLRGMEEQQIAAPPVWSGLLAVDEDPAAADRYLGQVIESLSATGFSGISDLYVSGILAQRVGRHAVALDQFERLEGCPASLDGLDYGWGLQALAQLHRAMSLEALGRFEESAAAYREFAEAWSDPDADLENTVAEARAAADRLEP